MRAIRFLSFGIFTIILVAATAAGLFAQDENRSTKVPLIGKIAGGTHRQAFSGKVQSVDTKRKLLLVDAVEGSYTEYFKVNGDFSVNEPGGKRTRVSKLTPGTNIIVYYEVKNDRREVTDILILGSQPPDKDAAPKKPGAPS
jgi:hypothetical protein